MSNVEGKEHHYIQQLTGWLEELEHQVEHDIEAAADDLIFHHEHPAAGHARVKIDCHAGPHKQNPYHAQEDFPISQLGSRPHTKDVYHQLGISIVTMEAAHALSSNCPAIPRIDLKYKGHQMTITQEVKSYLY